MSIKKSFVFIFPSFVLRVAKCEDNRNQIFIRLCILIFIFTSEFVPKSRKRAVFVFKVSFEQVINMISYLVIKELHKNTLVSVRRLNQQKFREQSYFNSSGSFQLIAAWGRRSTQRKTEISFLKRKRLSDWGMYPFHL